MVEDDQGEVDGATTSALSLVARSEFMPAMSIELAVERYGAVTEFVSRVLRRDVDYGIIPGTVKFTLLKPGAEKLTTFFGLSTRFQLIERIEDWTGAGYGGEPFFYYLYRCQLHRGDLLVAEADGSCNSRETKYRYREAQRTCPDCQQAAIIKGKEEYGGGWLCFKKKGGCGAKFLVGDPSIEGQQVGRVPNPDIADQVNTIQKMAQKRALIAATLLAVNASEFFTQDVEDFGAGLSTAGSAVIERAANEEGLMPSSEYHPGKDSGAEGKIIEGEILAACYLLGRTEVQLAGWLEKKYSGKQLSDLTIAQKGEVLALLNDKVVKQRAA